MKPEDAILKDGPHMDDKSLEMINLLESELKIWSFREAQKTFSWPLSLVGNLPCVFDYFYELEWIVSTKSSLTKRWIDRYGWTYTGDSFANITFLRPLPKTDRS